MSSPKFSEVSVNRRDLLRMIGGGFGLYGYASLLEDSRLRAAPLNTSTEPLAVKPSHFPARAKRVIFLFMNGGLSSVDTFDPKPQLTKHHGQPMPGGYVKTERKTGNLMRSPFQFKKYGQSGIEVSELFSEVAGHIDDICVIRSMHTEVPNHPPGMFLMNCGHLQPGRPSLGSWITYGLGTENQNLPGFMVLCPSGGPPTGGVPLWNSAFLPAVYQGTRIPNDQTTPDKLIHDIRNVNLTRRQQRRQLDLLDQLNHLHQQQRPADPQLEGSIHSMEIAYRMQVEAPRSSTFPRKVRPPWSATARVISPGAASWPCALWNEVFGSSRSISAPVNPGTATMTSWPINGWLGKPIQPWQPCCKT